MNTKELISKVILLPVDERVRVADSLLRSLNPPESDLDKKWALVAKHRLEEIKAGRVKTVPGKKVFQRVWERFSCGYL